MNINYITFAQNLQKLMDQKGIDRKKLCDDLGLKYVTVSSWLEARKYPRIDFMDLLARYFNVPIAFLSTKWNGQTISNKIEDEKSAPTDDGESEDKEFEKMYKSLTASEQADVRQFIAFKISQRGSDQ